MTAYAELLVGRCLDVQPGWQVTVRATPLARDLVEEVTRLIARRGAYALPRISWPGEQAGFGAAWAQVVPEERLDEVPRLAQLEADTVDAMLIVLSTENARDGAELPAERRARVSRAREPLLRRTRALEIPWNICQYPTAAAAQEAGMTTGQFEEFVFRACLLDWDALADTMRGWAARFDAAEELRIEAPGTDIRIGIAGRTAVVDDGKVNMPGGEFFLSPVEDATQGVIHYDEFPADFLGNRCKGVRLEFRDGRVVDASADENEPFLIQMLDMDDGARALGELGIGCNPGVDRYTGSLLFDEKIGGTIHLALGNAYAFAGGTNVSGLHWDMVKDVRRGGRLYLDGELVQENGEWLI
jgi:aminopeptidase